MLVLYLITFLSIFAQAQNVQLDWALNIGNAEDDEVKAVVHDSLGNIYLLGDFEETVDFDYGPNVFNLTSTPVNSTVSSLDIYLVKLDPDGNFLWVKTIGANRFEQARDMQLDNEGNLLIAGLFQGTVDFDLGSGVFNMSSAVSNSSEGFILKMDLNGNFIWAKKVDAWFEKISVDAQNNVIIKGIYSGLVDFDTGPGSFTLLSGTNGSKFVLKLNENGVFEWVNAFLVPIADIETDFLGNVYITGFFSGTTDFDPSSSVFLNSSNGSQDGYIVKLSPTGNFLWVESIGGTNQDEFTAISLDPDGNIYLGGFFRSNNIDFDNSSGTAIYSPVGNYDAFILKLDSSLNFDFVKIITGIGEVFPRTLATDKDNSIYFGGDCKGTNDFDPGPNLFNLSVSNGNDIFIAKLDSIGDFKWANQYGTPGTFWTNKVSDLSIIGPDTVLMTGYYQDVIDFNHGPGVFNVVNNSPPGFIDEEGFCLKLMPCSAADTTIDNAVGCGTYTWVDGITYTSNNTTAYFTLQNQNGCDSVVNLNLTMLPAQIRTDGRTECSGYTWINGTTYYSNNNTAIHTIPGVATNGCDSIIYLNLTIISMNISTTQTDVITIESNQPGATYRWLECDNNYAVIPGETGQSFTATTNGQYAVEVTYQGCTDTSFCRTINHVGFDKTNEPILLNVFPNPTNGIVNISSSSNSLLSFSLYNSLGQIVLKKENVNPDNNQFQIEGEAGVYTLEVTSESVVKQFQIIKK